MYHMRAASWPWACLSENPWLGMEIGFLNYVSSDFSICAATSYLWYMFFCVLFWSELLRLVQDGKILPALGSHFESEVWEWKLNLWTTSCLVFCLWGHGCCVCVCQALHWLVEMSLVNNTAQLDICVKRLNTVFNLWALEATGLSINTQTNVF